MQERDRAGGNDATRSLLGDFAAKFVLRDIRRCSISLEMIGISEPIGCSVFLTPPPGYSSQKTGWQFWVTNQYIRIRWFQRILIKSDRGTGPMKSRQPVERSVVQRPGANSSPARCREKMRRSASVFGPFSSSMSRGSFFGPDGTPPPDFRLARKSRFFKFQ